MQETSSHRSDRTKQAKKARILYAFMRRPQMLHAFVVLFLCSTFSTAGRGSFLFILNLFFPLFYCAGIAIVDHPFDCRHWFHTGRTIRSIGSHQVAKCIGQPSNKRFIAVARYTATHGGKFTRFFLCCGHVKRCAMQLKKLKLSEKHLVAHP